MLRIRRHSIEDRRRPWSKKNCTLLPYRWMRWVITKTTFLLTMLIRTSTITLSGPMKPSTWVDRWNLLHAEWWRLRTLWESGHLWVADNLYASFFKLGDKESTCHEVGNSDLSSSVVKFSLDNDGDACNSTLDDVGTGKSHCESP